MTAYSRAFVIKDLLFTVEATDYSNQVTKVTLTPDQNIQTLKTGVPDGAITDSDSPTWTLALSGINDNGAGSLGSALRTAYASGTDLDCVYQPKNASGQDKATFTIRPNALPFGGDVGSFHTMDLTVPVIGEPVFSQSS
jgi:hypothetical protein